MEITNPGAAAGNTAGQAQDLPGGIVFDTSSGISLEEQREILSGINAIAGGNGLVQETPAGAAKKRGFLFPLFVNLGALILLGAGFALLSLFHGQDEQGIRESSSTLGVTERKLIQEIRQETSRRISEKENEINGILAKLSAADTEYRELQVSVETLTEEQKERAAALLLMQEEYRGTLSALETEKTNIIEESRQQEADLRARADERAAELSSRIERSEASLDAASEELRRLGNEQQRAARAESQMSGYYTTVNNQISQGLLDEASATLNAMKEFLDTPSFRGVRSLEERKQTHLAAVTAMEATLAETRRLKEEAAAAVPGEGDGDNESAALLAANTALEEKVKDQERTIAALGSQDSEQGALIRDFESRLDELRNANDEKAGQIANLDSQITALNTRYDRAAADALNTQNALNAAVSERDAALAALREEHAALTLEKEELERQYNAVREAARTLFEE